MASDSAVIDLEGLGDVEDSDRFFTSSSTEEKLRERELRHQHAGTGNESHTTPAASGTSFFGDAQGVMTKMVWEAGKSQAAKAWSIYGNIDHLRPYFDVEPRDVVKRFIQSLIPKPPSATPIKIMSELYGPTMLTLTLIALLLFEMKSSGHTVREGTLIGTAFMTCFGYWLGCGSLLWTASYISNTHITYLQTLSMLGYSLTADCLVVLLSTIIHTSHDHVFFYLLWGTLGGLSTLRMISILISRTHGPTQKIVMSAMIVFLNLSFLLYLHFAYHQIVEDISQIIQKDSIDVPGNHEVPEGDTM